MPQLSSRVLHIEIDAYLPQTSGNVNRRLLEDKVKEAVKAAVSELRDQGIPVEKTDGRFRYFYRARIGEGSFTLRKKKRIVRQAA